MLSFIRAVSHTCLLHALLENDCMLYLKAIMGTEACPGGTGLKFLQQQQFLKKFLLVSTFKASAEYWVYVDRCL